jgi:hypothetical protein
MDLSILRMISTGSLSAFSAGATNGAIGRVPPPEAIRQARAQSAPPPNSLSAAPGGRTTPPTVQPGQTLPRGSLLDLSV